MTREELAARLRKLTGKTTDDIEALDERVDALEAGAGGGVELNTLDVTVTYTGSNHVFTGLISSEIPDTTVITEVIKIERVDVQGSGENAITQYYPLPTITGNAGLNNDFALTGYETYGKISRQTPIYPLELLFSKIDMTSNASEITATYKITYV